MRVKSVGFLGFVFVLCFAVTGFGAEGVAKDGVGVEAKSSVLDVNVRVYKNDVQVSHPAAQVVSGQAMDVTMQAQDKEGVRSHVIVDVVPMLVGDEIQVKGEVAVALVDGEKEKVVALVDGKVKDGVIRVPVELKGDRYVLEFGITVAE